MPLSSDESCRSLLLGGGDALAPRLLPASPTCTNDAFPTNPLSLGTSSITAAPIMPSSLSPSCLFSSGSLYTSINLNHSSCPQITASSAGDDGERRVKTNQHKKEALAVCLPLVLFGMCVRAGLDHSTNRSVSFAYTFFFVDFPAGAHPVASSSRIWKLDATFLAAAPVSREGIQKEERKGILDSVRFPSYFIPAIDVQPTKEDSLQRRTQGGDDGDAEWESRTTEGKISFGTTWRLLV